MELGVMFLNHHSAPFYTHKKKTLSDPSIWALKPLLGLIVLYFIGNVLGISAIGGMLNVCYRVMMGLKVLSLNPFGPL